MASGKIAGNGGTVVLDKELLDKIAFIKEGEFVETKGKPTLRLMNSNPHIVTHGIFYLLNSYFSTSHTFNLILL